MSFKVYFEDGRGNTMDEDGLEPVQMEVDEEAYPLDNITTYDSHLDLKPPEKKIQAKVKKLDRAPSNPNGSNVKKIHRGDDVKDMFFYYVYEKGLTAGKAASVMNVPRRTGYNWLKDDQDVVVGRLEGKNDDSRGE
ncbi:hypothetical protein BD408DRAFT_404940 [Parasitella parasitica]|nr:hypothetical protein BD408DRAFT_404940 [Parasitella parasitica]